MSVVARSATDAGARAGWLLCSLGLAVVLRFLVAGSAGSASEPAACLFALLLLAASASAGWRPGRLRPAALAWAVLGAAGLVAGPLVLHLAHPQPSVGFPAAAFPLWAVVVSGVAVGEEVLIRGALFAALQEYAGTMTALIVTAVVFALVHVPLYGVAALPLDLAVGLWLGGLRISSGGVAAPATAHVVADLAAWWLW